MLILDEFIRTHASSWSTRRREAKGVAGRLGKLVDAIFIRTTRRRVLLEDLELEAK